MHFFGVALTIREISFHLNTKVLSMEFLMLAALSTCVGITWLKPGKEGLAFGCFLLGLAICVVMFLIASTGFFVPQGAI